MKTLNKSQKVILTAWIVLIALMFVFTLTPVVETQGTTVLRSWTELNFTQFILGSIIISVPCLIIFRVWGK